MARIATSRYGRDYAGLSLLAGFEASDPTLIALGMQMSLLGSSLLQTDEERQKFAEVLAAIEQNTVGMTCIERFTEEHTPDTRSSSKPIRND